MKRIKLTPILLSLPILIFSFIYDIYNMSWTPFSFPIIIVFTVIICIALLVDRALVHWLSTKILWTIELILMVLSVSCFFRCM